MARPRTIAIDLAILAATATITVACTSIPGGTNTRDLTGTVSTSDWSSPDGIDTECIAGNGSRPPELKLGDAVIVKGPDGELLGKGELRNPDKDLPLDPGLLSYCRFPFSIADIPADLDLYQVALGSDPDRVVVFSRSDLDADGWSVALTFS
jgi:hypothetical protein